jgi:hypothetical protein
MSGTYDPLLLVSDMMRWLAKQGCQPQLRGSQVTLAEQAATELLLCLHVEPLRRGPPVAPAQHAPSGTEAAPTTDGVVGAAGHSWGPRRADRNRRQRPSLHSPVRRSPE